MVEKDFVIYFLSLCGSVHECVWICSCSCGEVSAYTTAHVWRSEDNGQCWLSSWGRVFSALWEPSWLAAHVLLPPPIGLHWDFSPFNVSSAFFRLWEPEHSSYTASAFITRLFIFTDQVGEFCCFPWLILHFTEYHRNSPLIVQICPPHGFFSSPNYF